MFLKTLAAGTLAAALVLLGGTPCRADQPLLGFRGTMVSLPRGYPNVRGMRVEAVLSGSRAAAMGLERGDIVVYIGRSMAFTTQEAYRYALRQQGRTTSIGVINVRNGRLVWLTCRLNHNPAPHYDESPPPGVVMVDFRSGP